MAKAFSRRTRAGSRGSPPRRMPFLSRTRGQRGHWVSMAGPSSSSDGAEATTLEEGGAIGGAGTDSSSL